MDNILTCLWNRKSEILFVLFAHRARDMMEGVQQDLVGVILVSLILSLMVSTLSSNHCHLSSLSFNSSSGLANPSSNDLNQVELEQNTIRYLSDLPFPWDRLWLFWRRSKRNRWGWLPKVKCCIAVYKIFFFFFFFIGSISVHFNLNKDYFWPL